MELLRLAFQHFARRFAASRLLVALALVGVLAGVAVLVAVSIFSSKLAEAGLRHVLSTTYQSTLDLMVAVQDRPLGPADYRRVDSLVQDSIQRRIGSMTRGARRYGKTQPLTLDGPLPPNENLATLFFFTGFEDKARLVEGRWPQPSEPGSLEVVTGAVAARIMGWRPGDTINIFPYPDDRSHRVPLRLTGTVEPQDSGDPYWVSGLPTFTPYDDGGGRPVAPFYLPERVFFDTFGATYPSLVGNFWWMVSLDASTLNAGNAGAARRELLTLESDINKGLPRSLVMSGMKPTLASYERGLLLARVPLYLYSGLLALFTLYFLFVVVGLLLATRQREVALVRSRGGGAGWTVMLTILGEAVVATGLAIVGGLGLGVLLGHVMVSQLQPIGIERGPLPGGLTLWVPGMAILLAVASLAVVMAAAYSLARREAVDLERERARPPRTGVVQRYYLDLLALATAAWLWWQVGLRGSFFDFGLDDGITVDLLSAVGPLLLLLASALALIRVFPWALWLLGRTLPTPWASFAFRRAARDSGPIGASVAVVFLVAALATYGGLLAASLAQGQSDRARYSVGGQIVLQGVSGSVADEARLRELGNLDGVKAISPTYRGRVTAQQGNQGQDIALLALEPRTLGATAWFRSDFSDSTLPELMDSIQYRGERRSGVPLPPDAQKLGVWVQLLESKALFQWNLTLWARVRDAEGRYENVSFGDLPRGTAWTHMEAALTGPYLSFAPPFYLTALFISSSDAPTPTSGTILIAEVTATGPSGAPAVVESYDGRRPWAAIASSAEGASTVEQTSEAARGPGSGARFQWSKRPQGQIGGIFIPEGPLEVPAVGGPGFSLGQRLALSSGRTVAPVVIAKTARYFPTLDPERSFLLVSMSEYQAYLAQSPSPGALSVNEVWLALQRGADRGTLVARIREAIGPSPSILDQEARVEMAQRDPFSGEAWLGFTAIGTGVLLALALLALLLHGAVSVHRGRLDLSTARVLGFAPRQVAYALLAERTLAALAGIAAGVALGLWLADWTLGFLDISTSGVRALPPAVLNVRAVMLIYVCGGLLATSLISTAATITMALRLKVSDVLRQEE
ncbi:MAG: hypothetical protein Q8O40_01400 [Chloroflexota bacterium]|nr:hypothetical protein [Chloroflexota bacterium]